MHGNSNVRKNLLELVNVIPQLVEFNYNQIVATYWLLIDNINDLGEVANVTPVETITRNFRRLVQDGLIVIPEHIRENRKKKEQQFRSEFSNLV